MFQLKFRLTDVDMDKQRSKENDEKKNDEDDEENDNDWMNKYKTQKKKIATKT